MSTENQILVLERRIAIFRQRIDEETMMLKDNREAMTFVDAHFNPHESRAAKILRWESTIVAIKRVIATLAPNAQQS